MQLSLADPITDCNDSNFLSRPLLTNQLQLDDVRIFIVGDLYTVALSRIFFLILLFRKKKCLDFIQYTMGKSIEWCLQED